MHGILFTMKLEVVQTLIDAGADVNRQDDNGDTALTWAAYRGYLEMIRFLIDARADVNLQNNQVTTALKIATNMGHTEIKEVLEALIEEEAQK